MKNDVSVLSVATGNAAGKMVAKAMNAKSSSKLQTSDFAKTLDQAQQGRAQSEQKAAVNEKVQQKVEQPKSAASKPAEDASTEAKPEVEVNEVEQAAKPEQPAETDKPSDATNGEQAEVAQELAAMANVSTMPELPMAELNTYFKGDSRLTAQVSELAINPEQSMQPTQTAMAQTAGQNLEQPLESLESAPAIEQLAPVTEETPSVAETAVTEATAPVAGEQKYVANSIEALLQSVKQQAQAAQAQPRQVAEQMQDTVAQPQLLAALTNQRVYTPAVAAEATEDVVNNQQVMNQLTELVGEVDVVQAPVNVAGQLQQDLTNSQGQQQGQQLPGEAAFDAAPVGEAVDVTVGNGAENASLQSQAMSFQQTLNAAEADAGTNQVQAPQQTAESYNVPQQIVEQARLIQNGQDSEMIIKLNPEHLGELSLKVSVNGNGGVTATFHSDNAQVRAILETSMVQLKQQLNEQGIKVDSVEVQTGLPDGQLPDGQNQQGYYQQQQGKQVRSAEADLRAFEETSEDLAATPVNSSTDVIRDGEGNAIANGVDYSV